MTAQYNCIIHEGPCSYIRVVKFISLLYITPQYYCYYVHIKLLLYYTVEHCVMTDETVPVHRSGC